MYSNQVKYSTVRSLREVCFSAKNRQFNAYEVTMRRTLVTDWQTYVQKFLQPSFVGPCPPFSVWPHLFCGAGHEKKRGEQLKWPLTFRLYIWKFSMYTQLPRPVHTARLGRMCFSILSLALCFACSIVLFDLFVCPHSFVFPWAVSLQFLALA